MPMQTKLERFSVWGGLLGLSLLPVSALGSRFGLWSFTFGFLLLFVAGVLALVVFFSSLLGLFRNRRKVRYGLSPALVIGLTCGILTISIFGSQLGSAFSAPPIHNISTNLSDPPAFRVVTGLREGANPHDYNPHELISGSTSLGEMQQAAYPNLTTYVSNLSVTEAVERTEFILREMDLDIVNVDSVEGLVEATATTFWFGFKDDVVVRLRRGGDSTLVDVHSVSRVGQGDLGANAKRIKEFIDKFSGH